MSNDEINHALLSVYEATADQLQRGLPVDQTELTRYHGMTGKLLANVTRSLWSQRELDEQIDKRVEERCARCDRSGVSGGKYALIQALTPWRWPFAVAVFSPFAGTAIVKIFSRLAGQ